MIQNTRTTTAPRLGQPPASPGTLPGETPVAGNFSALLAALFTNIAPPVQNTQTVSDSPEASLFGPQSSLLGNADQQRATLAGLEETLFGEPEEELLEATEVTVAAVPQDQLLASLLAANSQAVNPQLTATRRTAETPPILPQALAITGTRPPVDPTLAVPPQAATTVRAAEASPLAFPDVTEATPVSVTPTTVTAGNILPATETTVRTEASLPRELPATTDPTEQILEDLAVTTGRTDRQDATRTNTANTTSSPTVNATTTAPAAVTATTTPATTVATPAAATATATFTPAATASLQNGGRAVGQQTLVPGLPYLPATPLSTADANPRAFQALIGPERPPDAVTTLDSVGQISTTIGGTAQFAREQTDLADLNLLLRGAGRQVTGSAGIAADDFARTAPIPVKPGTAEQAPPTGTTPSGRIVFDCVIPWEPNQQVRTMNQVADAIALRAPQLPANGDGEIRVRLDPPELGQINIRIHSSNGQLSAEIAAADPAVRAMIESQLNDLKARLEQSGFSFQSFTMSQDNSGPGRDDQDPGYPGYPGGRRAPARHPVAQTSSPVNPNRGNLLDVTA